MSMTLIVAGMCAAHMASMAGFAMFPSLLPVLQPEWALTNTEAGWLNGILFAGYVTAVPLLVALTDRVDARRVYLVGLALNAAGLVGFAATADGFWPALGWLFVHGMGVGGTYMTGLKAMVDQFDRPAPSRAVTLYTGGFSFGTAMSIWLAGALATAWDWRTAFAAAALGPVAAAILARAVLRARPPAPNDTHLFDYRPVLRNRPAMGYILGYAGHLWELFALRGWIVTFLVFAGAAAAGGDGGVVATEFAAIVFIVGFAASLAGNELAQRFGRVRVCSTIMVASFVAAVATGAAAGVSLGIVLAIVVVHTMLVMGDSGALTAGAVAAAAVEHRGKTVALHTMLGFGCGFAGPLAVGAMLDLAGGQRDAWLLAYATLGAGSLFGLAALRALIRGPAAAGP